MTSQNKVNAGMTGDRASSNSGAQFTRSALSFTDGSASGARSSVALDGSAVRASNTREWCSECEMYELIPLRLCL